MGATDVSSSVGSAGRKGTKVIRTFHEVEVEKITMAEEWYEELECGMYVTLARAHFRLADINPIMKLLACPVGLSSAGSNPHVM